jgi:DUF4097 and DUF4098 domain-containing protein YvlB
MRDLLLLLGGIAAVLAILRVIAALASHRWSETLSFRGPITAVEVVIRSGDVTVRGDRRRDARVRRTLRAGLRRPTISEQVDAGVLRLHVASTNVHYEIDVPDTASVDVRAGKGSATVIGVAGDVRLQATGGSIEGRALAAPAVHATTGDGSIRLSFDRAPAMVEAATSTGSVDLALPAGPYEVDVEAAAGTTSVGVPTAGGCGKHVRARSSHGSVRIKPR